MIYIHGVCIPLIMISRATIIQLHTPNKYHGRLLSVAHLGVIRTTALSSSLAGIINVYISVKIVFLFIGIDPSLCKVLSLSVKQIRKIK